MTKIHTTTENECCGFCGYAVLDNCKFVLHSGKLTIHGKGLKLLHNSSLIVDNSAEIEVKDCCEEK